MPPIQVMHQVFDRATHVVRLSPRYNTLDLKWHTQDDESGVGWNSTTPFEYHMFDGFAGKDDADGWIQKKLQNKDLWHLLAPQSNTIPYIYADLTSWGNCSGEVSLCWCLFGQNTASH